MFKQKRILISAFLEQCDIEIGLQGDSPVLKSLIETINQQGGHSIYIPYSYFGFTGKMIGYMDRLKRKSISDKISGSYTRWMYTATFHFAIYLFSRVDFSLRRKVNRLREEGFDLCIFFYPYLLPTMSSLFKRSGRTEVVLFEVNIEKKFFQYQFNMSKLRILKSLFVKLIGMIEFKSISRADIIISIATRDARELSNLFPLKPIYSFVPAEYRGVTGMEKKDTVIIRDVKRKIRMELGPETVKVTFLGSNYSLNVSSVKEVISLARKMLELNRDVKFIVVGNISHSFGAEEDLPENVFFTGYLNDMKEVMSASDYFIMFDFMGTGIETKSRIYSEYPGLTLAFTKDSEEYSAILKDKLITFDSIGSIERFLKTIRRSTSSQGTGTIIQAQAD